MELGMDDAELHTLAGRRRNQRGRKSRRTPSRAPSTSSLSDEASSLRSGDARARRRALGSCLRSDTDDLTQTSVQTRFHASMIGEKAAESQLVGGLATTVSATEGAPAVSCSSLTHSSVPVLSVKTESLRPRYGTGLISSERFRVPATKSMTALVFDAWSWGPLEYLLHILLLLQLLATVRWFPVLDSWCADPQSNSRSNGVVASVMLFFCWRLAYNVGLGCLLRMQSQRAVMTHWWTNLSPVWKRWVRRCFRSSIVLEPRSSGEPPVDAETRRQQQLLPVDFEAWVAFRCLATIILANDGWSYLLLCYRVFHWPVVENWFLRPDMWLCYLLGAALIGFSFWAKTSAHRVVGDFAWYWGDFFFLMEGELTFDGVFELFPHPMYTVGYTAYYWL
ncbi:phosphatidylethanolamine N-methyltransferase [Cyanidiococcus yangmingshanensis]|uniref:Phosphatidylethanolamine N-methyltransferase n=1 Tax=Cyanidiococcus yangmingshanensis TaxID=2690220 RepID=A0A7J7IR26_9RHOD|nr:phosphatidylethanolamine N-methyltransferase [Cyanidiococcus yangmingshanensis]